MKQSVTQFLKFFKNYKYRKISVMLGLSALVFVGALIFYSFQKEQPLALSEVASAISAGKVAKIEDTPESGRLTITYKDASIHTALRDKASSFLEQMEALGV